MTTVMEPSLGDLITAVGQASSAEALLQAVRALAAHAHPDAAPALVEVLGYNNPAAAVAAVDGLISLGEAAVPALLELDPQNYGARAWAVRALAGIADVRGLGLLEDALGGDVAASVRRAAAHGLGRLRLDALLPPHREAVRQRCLTALKAACRDGEWVVRYAVAVGLETLCQELTPGGDLHGQAWISLKTLAAATEEPTPVVRSRARLALRRVQEPKA